MTAFESINEEQKIYKDLTVTPVGDFITADYYTIEKIGTVLSERQVIESPIPIDMIKFNGWSQNLLQLICLAFPTDNKIELELDAISMVIRKKIK